VELGTLKRGLLLLWAAWFSLVCVMNILGGLKAAGMLRPSWKFASKNYEAVAKAVSVYRAPRWLPAILFAGVISWELAAACLYFAAFAAGGMPGAAAHAAFATGIGLMAAFMLADELTLRYAFEQGHQLLLITQLACLLALHLLP
jgi:hypothetical protein